MPVQARLSFLRQSLEETYAKPVQQPTPRSLQERAQEFHVGTVLPIANTLQNRASDLVEAPAASQQDFSSDPPQTQHYSREVRLEHRLDEVSRRSHHSLAHHAQHHHRRDAAPHAGTLSAVGSVYRRGNLFSTKEKDRPYEVLICSLL